MTHLKAKPMSKYWKANEIISIKIDRNDWIITFYLNNEKQFEMDLQKDLDYYLMIVTNGTFEFRLLS